MEGGRRGTRGCGRGSMGGEDPAIEKMETLKHSSIFLDYPASLLMPAENLPLKGPRNSSRDHGPESKKLRDYARELQNCSPRGSAGDCASSCQCENYENSPSKGGRLHF